MKNINKYLIGISTFIFIFTFPFLTVFAATIGFSSSSATYNVGDTINVKVYVNSSSISINAISASIKYSTDLLFLSSVSKVGSILNLWAQEPSFSNNEGVASFEGVVLNGYTGNSGNAVTLIFKAKAVGIANISFNSASVLANNGNGTEVLNSKGTINIKIIKPNTEPTIISKTKALDTTIVISEIKNNLPKYSPNKFLITSPQPVADKSYSIQIDSQSSVLWADDGTHIYQAPELSNGIHTIKVMAVDVNSNSLSGFLNFSTTILKVPVITYYPTELFVDQFMVLKGLADPNTDIEITSTNIKIGAITIDHVFTNGDGEFTYVPDNKLIKGVYSIVARTISSSGISSDYMQPIQVESKQHNINSFISGISNFIILLIPLIALIIFIIFIIIYTYHKLKKFQFYLKKKVSSTQNIVTKQFDILDKDIEREFIIFKKIREHEILNSKEKIFLDKFKDDINETEKVISENLEEIEKNNNV